MGHPQTPCFLIPNDPNGRPWLGWFGGIHGYPLYLLEIMIKKLLDLHPAYVSTDPTENPTLLLVYVPRMNWTSFPMFLYYIWFVHIRLICSRCLTMLAYLQNVWLLCVKNLWMSTHPDSTTVNIIYITMLPPFCHHVIIKIAKTTCFHFIQLNGCVICFLIS
jgi:hypothetical protein